MKLLSERPQGSLLSKTEANPQKHLKAITLRSDKEVEMGRETTFTKERNQL